DREGFIYCFRIPTRSGAHLKCGRSRDPPKRQLQWKKKCPGQIQIWDYCWFVPFASKFGACFFANNVVHSNFRLEALIHKHLKMIGAWLGQKKRCAHCKTCHREKFRLRQ
ncbi:hypothetical protein DFH07DRAFT_712533, partial [Mycena maculata]